jgi:hypothetical protein
MKLAAALAIAAIVSSFASTAHAATPSEVEASIDKGKKFLYSLQRPEGRWEPDAQRKGNNHHDHPKMQGSAWGGFTAVATYALLASGENPQDPRMAKAIEFLKTADSSSLRPRCACWRSATPSG